MTPTTRRIPRQARRNNESEGESENECERTKLQILRQWFHPLEDGFTKVLRLDYDEEHVAFSNEMLLVSSSSSSSLHPKKPVIGTFFFVEKDTLVHRMRIDAQLCLRYASSKSNNNNLHLPLSAFLSIFDEVTSLAAIVRDSTRRGVSLSLVAEWAGDENFVLADSKDNSAVIMVKPGTRPGDIVDFRARVIRMGKQVIFMEGTAVHVATGQPICWVKHIFFIVVTTPPVEPLTTTIGEDATPIVVDRDSWMEFHPSPSLDKEVLVIFAPSRDEEEEEETTIPSLEQILPPASPGTAPLMRPRFDIDPLVHFNAMGTLHGGCHAMCMERMTWAAARHLLQTSAITMESIQVFYLSAAREATTVEADIQVLRSCHDECTTLLVRLWLLEAPGAEGTLSSQGILKWRRVSRALSPKRVQETTRLVDAPTRCRL